MFFLLGVDRGQSLQIITWFLITIIITCLSPKHITRDLMSCSVVLNFVYFLKHSSTSRQNSSKALIIHSELLHIWVKRTWKRTEAHNPEVSVNISHLAMACQLRVFSCEISRSHVGVPSWLEFPLIYITKDVSGDWRSSPVVRICKHPWISIH